MVGAGTHGAKVSRDAAHRYNAGMASRISLWRKTKKERNEERVGIPANLIAQITNASAKARAGGGGEDLRDGSYSCTIEKIVCGEMNSGTLIVIAVRVTAAQAVRDDVKPNCVGSTVRFVLNFSDVRTKEVAPKNWREFLEALDGCEQNAMSHDEISQHTAAVAADESCYRGVQIGLSSYRKMRKDKTKELVLGAWRHVAGQTEETIKASREALDRPSA